MIKSLSDTDILVEIRELLSPKRPIDWTEQDSINKLFDVSLFDFIFATSDYAKNSL
jgi:hypothetical protein